MKRHESLQPLSRDHHEMLIVAQLLKADAPHYKQLPQDLTGRSQYALKCYDSLIKDHWRKEEEHLFPFVGGRDPRIDQLIYVLQDDHVELELGFERLGAEVNQALAMDALGKLLERHIRTEERELFQLIQEVLNTKDLDALGKAMNT